MTFKFDYQPDADRQAKRSPTPANPAKAANPDRISERISNISKVSNSNPLDPKGWGYTPADLKKMDALLRELAELEGWTPAELEEMLDRRRRMAPARVPEVLQTLQASRDAQLANWPAQPKERARFALTTLTVIEGGKRDSEPSKSSKTPVSGRGAA
jgi:hypothetical protein